MRESKYKRRGKLPTPARAEVRQRPGPVSGSPPSGREKFSQRPSPRKIVRRRSSDSSAPEEDHARRRHGSTHRRRKLRGADGISCSRISVNQVTMRPKSTGGDDKLHGIGASESQKYPSPWRDAPRRAALRFRVAVYDGSGKGGNAATPRGDFIDRTIDSTRVSAVRLLPRQRVGGKVDGGTTKLSASRCRVTSPCFARNCLEIARHEAPSLAARFPLTSFPNSTLYPTS